MGSKYPIVIEASFVKDQEPHLKRLKRGLIPTLESEGKIQADKGQGRSQSIIMNPSLSVGLIGAGVLLIDEATTFYLPQARLVKCANHNLALVSVT